MGTLEHVSHLTNDYFHVTNLHLDLFKSMTSSTSCLSPSLISCGGLWKLAIVNQVFTIRFQEHHIECRELKIARGESRKATALIWSIIQKDLNFLKAHLRQRVGCCDVEAYMIFNLEILRSGLGFKIWES